MSVVEDDEGVTINVRDHGPGLPAKSHENIFDRFWRSEGGRGRGKAGAGLGLAIVQGVLDAHGGQITAQNAPGGGALFSVRLPKSAPAASQPAGS
jgi:two-component system OmpR family sensor kinase